MYKVAKKRTARPPLKDRALRNPGEWLGEEIRRGVWREAGKKVSFRPGVLETGASKRGYYGLFDPSVEGLVPLACLGGNLIAPLEKTSPRPSHNGWDPFYPEIKPMIWATAS